jgi:hypothetical protein
LAVTALVAPPNVAHALQPTDLVKISEVHYDPPEVPETSFEFVELYNAGASTVFLDGAVISDQGNNGANETTFQFPGTPLVGMTLPLAVGEFLLIAVSATDSPYPGIDFEFYGGIGDTDHPGVPNLVKTSGIGNDLGLANTGDGLTLSTGVSNGNVIACAEIVDGLSWEDGGGIGEVTATSHVQCSDPAPHPGTWDTTRSLQRVGNGNDTDRSAADFDIAIRTPGGAAPCLVGSLCVGDLSYEPCVPSANQPVTVSLRVTAPPGGWSLELFHKRDGAALYDSTAMVVAADSTFRGTVPGFGNQVRVQYWVRVTDPLGNVVAVPPGGAAAPADYLVGVVAIAAIQGSVVADSCASSTLKGKAVNVRGVVVHEAAEFDLQYFYVQRGTGPNSGIRIYTPQLGFIPGRGDSVQISGVVDEVDCETQVVMFSGCGQTLGHRFFVPRALGSLAQMTLEENEGMLVHVNGPFTVATPFDTTGGDFEFGIANTTGAGWVGGDTFSPDLVGYTYVPNVGDVLDAVTGIVRARRPTAADATTKLRIEPRRDPDIDREYSDSEPPPLAVIGPFRIGRNVPNPFNPTTTIEYEIDAAAAVELRIYDAAGRLVRVLLAGERIVTAGAHRALWDGRDDAGRTVSSGLYVVQLASGGRTATRKMLLLR